MVVRFLCAACSQPIEVDDEWASRTVACPYCRKTVTAPIESTLPDLQHIPMASPASPSEQATLTTALQPPRNSLATAALVLLGAMFLLVVTSGILQKLHQNELGELLRAIMEAPDYHGKIQAQMRYYEDRGGVPGWMAAITLLYLGSGMCWLAAVICTAIALRRPWRRHLAVTALVLSLVMPILLYCFGPVAFNAIGSSSSGS